MMSIHPTLFATLLEVAAGFAVVSAALGVLALRRWRQNTSVLKQVVPSLGDSEPHRFNAIRTALTEGGADHPDKTAEDLVKGENAFFRYLLGALLSGKSEQLLELEPRFRATLAPYLELIRQRPAGSADGGTASHAADVIAQITEQNDRLMAELTGLRADNTRLLKELQKSHNDMRAILTEYASAFAGGNRRPAQTDQEEAPIPQRAGSLEQQEAEVANRPQGSVELAEEASTEKPHATGGDEINDELAAIADVMENAEEDDDSGHALTESDEDEEQFDQITAEVERSDPALDPALDSQLDEMPDDLLGDDSAGGDSQSSQAAAPRTPIPLPDDSVLGDFARASASAAEIEQLLEQPQSGAVEEPDHVRDGEGATEQATQEVDEGATEADADPWQDAVDHLPESDDTADQDMLDAGGDAAQDPDVEEVSPEADESMADLAADIDSLIAGDDEDPLAPNGSPETAPRRTGGEVDTDDDAVSGPDPKTTQRKPADYDADQLADDLDALLK